MNVKRQLTRMREYSINKTRDGNSKLWCLTGILYTVDVAMIVICRDSQHKTTTYGLLPFPEPALSSSSIPINHQSLTAM